MSDPAVAGWPLGRLASLRLTRRSAALALGALAALLYAGSLWNGFAYDDVAIIAGDPRIRGFDFSALWSLPYWRRAPELAIYRPLTSLTFAVDWFIGHGQPWLFHLMNCLQHGIVTALVFLLLAELCALPAAAAGALLFAIHPVHVEAVANVVGRAELLSAICYLAAIVIWLRAGSRSTVRSVVLVAGCYAAALLFKESSATLPAAIVLMDAAAGRWRINARDLAAYVRRALPLIVVLAVVLAAFLVLRHRVLGRLAPSIVDPIFDLGAPTGVRVRTALQAWTEYARLLFYPRTLLADYSPRVLMPAFVWTPRAILGGLILASLVFGGLLALDRKRGLLAAGLLWFPLTLLPASNLLFPIGIAVAERTLYLPLMALSIGAAGLFAWAAGAAPARRRALAALGALAAVALLVRTVTRIPDWETTDRVFYALAADRPQSFRAAWHLARVARNEKKYALEMQRYHKAMQLWPFRRALVLEAATEALAHQQPLDGRNWAALGARRWPNDARALRLLAEGSLAVGDTTTARAAVTAGLRLAPTDTSLLRVARTSGVSGTPQVSP